MKKILLILIVLQAVCLSAQTITVKDKSSLQPLEGVEITAYSKSRPSENTVLKGTTNSNGQLTLNQGNITWLKFVKSGYFSDSMSIDNNTLKSMDYTVFLTEKSNDFSGAVVSASRFEEKMEDVSQQVTVIDKKQMQFMNQPTTAELIQQSGRAFVQKSQAAGGSITMRGFEANKVLMVVDGVRMNNAIYRGGHLQNVLSVDNNMLDKTEMLFGPGSVVYGSDALGGVIHFYTKNPVLSKDGKTNFKAMAFTRLGTAMNEKTSHFDVNFGYKKIAFLSSFTYSDFGDMTIGKRGTKGYESWGRRTFTAQRFGNTDSMVANADSFKQIPTGYKQWDLMQKVLFKQNAHVSHLLNLQHSNTTDFPRYDRLTELGSNQKPSQAQWYYGPQTRTLVSYKLSVTKKTDAFDNLNVIAAYQDIKESRHNRGFGSSNLSHRNEHVKVLTLNADFQKEISKKTELRYGAEIMDNDVQSTASRENVKTGAITPQSTRYPDGGSVMRSSAVYLTQNTYFSPRFILNSGIRFTNIYLKSIFNDKTFFPFLNNSIEQRNQNTSGSIGLVYLGKKELRIAGNIASGFRAANVDDMAKVFESVGGRIIIPNAFVKPEQTTTIDVTVSKTFKKKLQVEVNGYYTSFTNALTLGRAQLNGKDTITYNGVLSTIYSTQNAQSAYIYGYFAGVNYDVSKKLSFSGTINYTYGRINTDTVDYPLDHISPVYGRVGVIYKSRKWKAEAFSIFNGAKKSADYNLIGEDNQIYSADPVKGFSPAWYTINVRGFYQINKLLQVQLAIENILDQHYRTFSSGTSAPGRNVVMTLRGNF
ncbi:MAG: TonB-dependent receptor plug domain-containing protein [Chitinophagaceae bacterium]